jgi:ferredoxin-NADP reductase
VAQPPGRPKGFIQAPVLAVFNETNDIKTIRIARPGGFEFAAGQFITVRIRVDGKDCSRCYSLSSAPDVRGYLEISVKRQGLVSNALHATARPGAMMSIRSPNGAFKYPSGDDRPIVLLAGGVGITPLMSMLRHGVQTEPSRPITLLYSARTPSDFAFHDELMALARRHPQIRVHLASTKSSSPDLYPGRIDSALIGATLPDVAHSI